MNRNFFYAVAILIGTIVGAGIFALPYAIAQTGFFIGVFYLILMTTIVTYLHLAFGEIILRTNAEQRLPGYINIYLSKNFKTTFSISHITGLLLTIIVYILVGGEFLSQIFSNFLSPSIFYLIFWGIGSFLILSGFKIFTKAEFFMTAFLVIVILLIFFIILPKVNLDYFLDFNTKNLFLPYGVILFSLLGGVAIPELKLVLINEKWKLKPAIIWGTVLSAFIYLIFVFTVIGVSGLSTEKFATLNLAKILPQEINFLISILGFLLIITSYITVGRYLKESLNYDFKLNNFIASFIVIFIPIFLILLGFKDFIFFISFIGSLMGSFEGIIMMLAYLKAKKYGQRVPEYSLKINNFFIYILILILAFGFLLSLIY